jgi:uncharacterized protein
LLCIKEVVAVPKPTLRTISPATARRLAISAQHLNQPRQPVDAAAILNLVRQIGCLQLDPISAVARSHTLVLFSRLGPYDLAHLDTLLWEECQLFEYWAHAASIVLTEDYPVHLAMMHHYREGDSGWAQRTVAWMAENEALRQNIVSEITKHGALPSKYFEDKSVAGWESSGWTGGRNVSRMLDFLWTSGELMVAGRKGGQKLWDLTERCLPEWTPRDLMPAHERVSYAAQKSLRALGVGRTQHIQQHYVRGRYENLSDVVKSLERDGQFERVQIAEMGDEAWPGVWYIHHDTLPLLERIEAGGWQQTTRLLSPFDNLICDRARTELLFDFRFRIEIYVPKAKRQYGYYVLPILHGDRLIGRIDPLMNRKTATLEINNVYAESDAPMDEATGRAVADSVEELAAFLGAKTITYGDNVPEGWRKALNA